MPWEYVRQDVVYEHGVVASSHQSYIPDEMVSSPQIRWLTLRRRLTPGLLWDFQSTLNTSQSSGNTLAKSKRHSGGTSRGAKRPRSNYEQQDEEEGRSFRGALGASRQTSVTDTLVEQPESRERPTPRHTSEVSWDEITRSRKQTQRQGGNTHKKMRDKNGRRLNILGSPHRSHL